LKHGRDHIAVRIRVLSPDARDPRARAVLALILRYIAETSRTPAGTLQRLLAEQVGPKVAEDVMTLAEQLRRGGRREGETTGMRSVLLRQLRQRFGALPSDALERIEKGDRAALNAWTSRVLTAASLDEVLGAKARRRA